MEDDSELVLERIMEDGTFDELRKRIVELVKQDVCHCKLADHIETFIPSQASLNSYNYCTYFECRSS
jgi:hypothetical protein